MRLGTEKWITKQAGYEVDGVPEDCGKTSDALARTVRLSIPHDGQEHLFVLALDVHGKALASSIVSSGSVDNCPVYPRDVYAWALTVPRCRFVGIAHNHPSGDVTPSGPDKTATAAVAFAGQVIGLDLVWHVVVTHQSDDWAEVKAPAMKQGKGGDDQAPRMPQDPQDGPQDGDEPEDGPEDGGDSGDEDGGEKGQPDNDFLPPDGPESDDGQGGEAVQRPGDHTPVSADELRAAAKRAFGIK